jgi:hypothetical protein
MTKRLNRYIVQGNVFIVKSDEVYLNYSTKF